MVEILIIFEGVTKANEIGGPALTGPSDVSKLVLFFVRVDIFGRFFPPSRDRVGALNGVITRVGFHLQLNIRPDCISWIFFVFRGCRT